MLQRIGKKLGRGGRRLRIAYGRCFQEANAFSPLPTVRRDFEVMHHLEGADLAQAASLFGTELKDVFPVAELSGMVQAAALAGGVDTVPLWSNLAVSGGPLTRETFDWLLEGTLQRLADAGDVDGVYLALHGSMQVQGLQESPEGVILRHVREQIGPDKGLAASFDLHGNLTQSIIDPCDVVVAFHTNPHRDLFQTGMRAGNLLIRALRGQVRPVHAWRKLPMVMGAGSASTFCRRCAASSVT